MNRFIFSSIVLLFTTLFVTACKNPLNVSSTKSIFVPVSDKSPPVILDFVPVSDKSSEMLFCYYKSKIADNKTPQNTFDIEDFGSPELVNFSISDKAIQYPVKISEFITEIFSTLKNEFDEKSKKDKANTIIYRTPTEGKGLIKDENGTYSQFQYQVLVDVKKTLLAYLVGSLVGAGVALANDSNPTYGGFLGFIIPVACQLHFQKVEKEKEFSDIFGIEKSASLSGCKITNPIINAEVRKEIIEDDSSGNDQLYPVKSDSFKTQEIIDQLLKLGSLGVDKSIYRELSSLLNSDKRQQVYFESKFDNTVELIERVISSIHEQGSLGSRSLCPTLKVGHSYLSGIEELRN